MTNDVDVRMIIHRVETDRERCLVECWYPDDTSKQEGYIEAMDDLLEYLKGLLP